MAEGTLLACHISSWQRGIPATVSDTVNNTAPNGERRHSPARSDRFGPRVRRCISRSWARVLPGTCFSRNPVLPSADVFLVDGPYASSLDDGTSRCGDTPATVSDTVLSLSLFLSALPAVARADPVSMFLRQWRSPKPRRRARVYTRRMFLTQKAW